ncbi:MAG: hypothetical protein C0609_05350 [Deltaproteobacteria bacterium]|nr:MAG: hypothetical protein C0609_05350 [Deltaproteobacteria bacterium]
MWRELINIWKSHNLLEQAWNESFEMLEIDRRMYLEAVRVLREADDAALNEDIRQLDKKVNKYERDVRRKVMTHCAVEGAHDLTSGMILISLVIDIERVGDYCKNILDLAQMHPKTLKVSHYDKALTLIENEVKERFNRTIEALKNQDVEAARSLMRTYKQEVGRECDKIVEDLVSGTCVDLSSADATTLALYARYLKRISAHLNNMATSVVNPFHRLGFKEKESKN